MIQRNVYHQNLSWLIGMKKELERGEDFLNGETVVAHFAPTEITATEAEVARYAGGSRYRPDAKLEAEVADVLSMATGLVSPGAVYGFHRIQQVLDEGAIRLEGGIEVKLPVSDHWDETQYLGAAVITIGKALEEEVKVLHAGGDWVRALFLDAAGVALLKALDSKMIERLREQAEELGLHLTCRMGPGLNDVPLEVQRQLFQLVDPSVLGVHINDQLVMMPAKSVSFFARFARRPVQVGSAFNCRSCELKSCIYRMNSGIGH